MKIISPCLRTMLISHPWPYLLDFYELLMCIHVRLLGNDSLNSCIYMYVDVLSSNRDSLSLAPSSSVDTLTSVVV